MSRTSYYASALDTISAPIAALVLVLNLVQYFVISFQGGKHRGEMFNKEFMKENFNEQHWNAFKKDAPLLGYPDCGSGVFSAKLTYGQWFRFNLAQRNAKNYQEQLTMFVFALFILIPVWPVASIIFGAVNFIARIAFVSLYNKAP